MSQDEWIFALNAGVLAVIVAAAVSAWVSEWRATRRAAKSIEEATPWAGS